MTSEELGYTIQGTIINLGLFYATGLGATLGYVDVPSGTWFIVGQASSTTGVSNRKLSTAFGTVGIPEGTSAGFVAGNQDILVISCPTLVAGTYTVSYSIIYSNTTSSPVRVYFNIQCVAGGSMTIVNDINAHKFYITRVG
jgi:hypothetical protein